MAAWGWLGQREVNLQHLSREEIEALVHELQVRQIELEQQNQSLRQGEPLFRALVENSPNPIVRLNRKGRHLYVNPAFAHAMGLPVEEIIGKTNQDLGVPEAHQQIFDAARHKVYETGSEESIEFTYPTPEGKRHFYVRLAPEFSEDGSVKTLLAITHDITRLKRAEEALRESEEKFKSIFEESPIGIGIHDAEGKLLHINDACLDIFGISDREEVREFDLFEDPNLPDNEKAKLRAGEAVRYEVAFSFEKVRGLTLYETGKAGIRYLDVRTTPLGSKGTDIAGGYLIQVQDITERKLAAEALRESWERYRMVVETSPDAVAISNLEGRLTFVSPRGLELHGYEDPEEVIGRYVLEFIAPEDREKAAYHMQETLEKGAVRNVEYTMLRKDGSRFVGELSAAALRDTKGAPTSFVGITRDITKRRHTEDALRASEKRFRNVLETMSLIAVMLDTEGNIIFCNDFLLHLTGWEREEVLNKDWFSLFLLPEVRDEVKQVFLRIIQTNEFPTHYENEIITREGERRLIAWNNSVYYTAQGNVIGMTGIGEDITERRQAEQRERELAAERERVNILGNFMRSVSQEFRTPLSTINTRLYMVEKLMEPDRRLAQSKIIREQVTYLSKLIEDILVISQLESGAEFHFTPLDLHRLMRDIGARMRPLAERRRIAFTLDLDSTVPLVYGDHGQLQRAFTGMVENAVNYTQDGGTVAIRMSAQDDAVAWVEIKDTGIGIGEADLPHIFDPFYRVDEAREARRIGLGLSIAQKIIEAHRGRIEVESELGEGCTFTIMLPIEP